MEKSTKRGKIPQSDWPSIIARYNTGETLASIARTYDCSPPAISYVVSRSKERDPVDPPPAPPATAPEVQLVKAAASEPPAAKPPAPNGAAGDGQAPPALTSADHRPTLHLSLGASPGNGSQPANGGPALPPPRVAPPERVAEFERVAAPPERPAPPPEHPALPTFAEPRPVAYVAPEPQGEERRGNGAPKNGAGVFIDRDLRARVDSDITAFLAAFDAALNEDTQQSRSALREATDRLLRAGARTRIELERLEARLPLPPRETIARGEPAWRHR